MPAPDGTPAGAPVHAVAAEFDSGGALLAGVLALKDRGLGHLDAHTPVPVAGLGEALGLGSSSLSLVSVGAALLGFAAMMGMCIYATAADYVFNIGGRPLVSWPSFVVPSASFALAASAAATFGTLLFLNRWPRLNHPCFNIPGFSRASQDRYFLTVSRRGEDDVDLEAVEAALGGLAARPSRVTRVPR